MRKIRVLIAALLIVVGVTGIVGLAEAASATLTVPHGTYGGNVTATLEPAGNRELYVFVQCFNPEYVYAAYFPIVDGQAEIGPLASTLWPSGPADCNAEAGWFTARGFGVWKSVASTTFSVT